MLYFPKSDDTIDLKILIKKQIFDYKSKSGNLRTALVKRKGKEKGQGYTYDWDYEYDTVKFDNDFIYINNETVSLADLLVNKIIPYELLDDDVKYILEKRNLSTEPINYGDTEADFYEGESFGSTDYSYSGYVIVSNQ